MRPLVVFVVLAALLALYIHERMHRYVMVPAGENKAFLLDTVTGKVRILMGVGSMPVNLDACNSGC